MPAGPPPARAADPPGRRGAGAVAGIVVAIGTVVLPLVDRLRHRAPAGTMAALTVAVAVWGASSLDSTPDPLLQRLASAR